MADVRLLMLTIAKVDDPIFNGLVKAVTVPGVEGEMTLMAHHEPIISPLKRGTIVVRLEDGSEESFSIESGTLEMSQNHATILI